MTTGILAGLVGALFAGLGFMGGHPLLWWSLAGVAWTISFLAFDFVLEDHKTRRARMRADD